MIWASARYKVVERIGTILDGSCEKTKNLSLWLHLAINALSTILLGASNYCMQCLSSPTRQEVDKAHNQGIWLDIGVPGIRNLRRISRRRLVLWMLLTLSSIPLHLLYNSAVFITLATQSYKVFLGPSDLWTSQKPNGTFVKPIAPTYPWTFQHSSPDISTFRKMDNAECIKAYSKEFVAANSDVILISTRVRDGKGVIEVPSDSDNALPYKWICSPSFHETYENCDTNGILKDPNRWMLSMSEVYSDDLKAFMDLPLETEEVQIPVDYCLSKPAKEQCRLQYSFDILIVVIICNFIKAMSMLLMLWTQKTPPLATLGDAIASFLGVPDCCTQKYRHRNNKRRLWISSMSFRRWCSCNLL